MPINGEIFLKKMDQFVESTGRHISTTEKLLKRMEDFFELEDEKQKQEQKLLNKRVYVKVKDPLEEISSKIGTSNILLQDILKAVKRKGGLFDGDFDLKSLIPLGLGFTAIATVLPTILEFIKNWKNPLNNKNTEIIYKTSQSIFDDQKKRGFIYTPEEEKKIKDINNRMIELYGKLYGKGDTSGNRIYTFFQEKMSPLLKPLKENRENFNRNNPNYHKNTFKLFKKFDNWVDDFLDVNNRERSIENEYQAEIDNLQQELMKIYKEGQKRGEESKTYISPEYSNIMKRIIMEEGISGYDKKSKKYYPYLDQNKNATIGIGHFINPGEDYSKGLSENEVYDLFNKDFNNTLKIVKNRFPNFDKLNQKQQEAIIDLTYNMGSGWFTKKHPKYWPSLVNAIQAQDSDAIISIIRNSPKLYDVNPKRAERNIIALTENIQNAQLKQNSVLPKIEDVQTFEQIISRSMESLKDLLSGKNGGMVLSDSTLQKLGTIISKNIPVPQTGPNINYVDPRK